MKNPLLVLIFSASITLSIAWTVCDIKPRKKMKVVGTISVWQPPVPNFSDSLRKRQDFRPVATTMYVQRVNHGYRGIMPICDTLVSDSAGNFTTELENGDYKIFEAWQLQPLVMPKDSGGITYDTACIREKYKEPAYNLHLTGDSVRIKYFPKDAKFRRCRNK